MDDVSKKKRNLYTVERKKIIAEGYDPRTMCLREYAKEHGVSHSSFSRWIQNLPKFNSISNKRKTFKIKNQNETRKWKVEEDKLNEIIKKKISKKRIVTKMYITSTMQSKVPFS